MAERAALEQLWQQRRERAAYEAERAAKQYHTVDPDHRLVARTLERAWEEKLAAQQQLDEDYHRFQRDQPGVLSAQERAAIRLVAADIPALWATPTTTDADRKEIVRQVLERVVVDAQGTSERVRLTLHWAGGEPTVGELTRPIGRTDRLSYYPALCERVRALAAAGYSGPAIAQRLDVEGYRPPRGAHFGAQEIRALRERLGIPAGRSRPTPRDELGPHEWWAAELAAELAMPQGTLANWIGRGWVRARPRERPPARWIVWADETEVARLHALRQRPLDATLRQRWLDRPPQTEAAIDAASAQ